MPATFEKKIEAWADGCCLGNPGPGGYGVVLLHDGHRKELKGGFKHTTNNRMEILAAIKTLEALKEKCHVVLHSDSQYVVKAMNEGWAEKWKSRGWKTQGNQPAMNPDLWQRLLRLRLDHKVEFKWVKGHSGVPENERADELAKEAAQGADLEEDAGYLLPR
ncbi:MAG TPA: ribonuclease HI [Fibrobacteres bacterium]|jgi:ribonuclease HI|nr:ribonuclease HI [Fibrobacterota bacterium]